MIRRFLLPVVAFLATLVPFSFSAAESASAEGSTAAPSADICTVNLPSIWAGAFTTAFGSAKARRFPTRGMRSDIVAALRKLKIPDLRWPGGYFADDYHWRTASGRKTNAPNERIALGPGDRNQRLRHAQNLMFVSSSIASRPRRGHVGSGTPQEMRAQSYMTFDGDSARQSARANGREKPLED